ncbi:MAG TPA: glycoside hydrolase family 97 protein [Terracidiphilus sp.]|nr:glycoside hydrolase family 97 protein [Terracidiphilus sp.]
MPTLRATLSCLLAIFFAGTLTAQTGTANLVKVTSPNGHITLMLLDAGAAKGGSEQAAAGTPASADLRYAVEFHGQRLMETARLGLDLVGQPALGPGMHLTGTKPESVDETYSIPVGKTSSVRNHFNGVRADFADGSGRKLTIEVRAFDDGVAFRYVVPEQASLKQVRIANELTEFVYAKDAATYPLILGGYQSSWEDEYQQRQVSGLHPDWLIGLPYLAEEPGIGWVAITEADIDNYAGMYLRKDRVFGSRKVMADLSPLVNEVGVSVPGVAVKTSTPFNSPWRVLMIGDEPGRLIESNIVLNLNPPSMIADTSWIQAGKSAWDWWSGEAAPSVSFKTGMNTATMKHYIDFASASGFPYMLIDAGWAMAPERKGPDDYSRLADITRVTPEVDMPELLRYAKEKHVKLWLWAHWTSVNKYMDQAFPLFEQWGIAGVKIDFMNRDDQWMVDFYHRVVESAATHHLMIDFHGAYKPDGLRRTYPNLITREGVMGKEYLKVSARTTPAHNATLPFTRMLAGPMDYTPGAFGNSNRENFVARNVMPMGLGTRAQELALFVVFESPFQMVSDYPEHYAGQKEFDFIKQVPATWDEVHAVSGRPMEWISLARRSGKDWYVGSLTNWDQRDVKVPLNFLGDGKYVAEIYADAPDAAVEATHTTMSMQPVDRTTVLNVHMVSGGGNAIWIHPAGNP